VHELRSAQNVCSDPHIARQGHKGTYDRQMGRSAGLVIIAVGVVIVMIGLLALSGALNWFGRLPGDVRIRNEHSRIYIPIVSSIVISLVLSLILSLARRFF
jgi:uncharacterized membrane protein YidH (DUF202 family)